jgi:predicted MPP superfamily phosphohydrolase
MLAGHTQATQVFPATLITALLFPFTKGLYGFEGMHVHISPGVGTFLAPLRVGTTNTITLIRLVPEQ